MNETIREYVNPRLGWFYLCWAIGLGLLFVAHVLREHETPLNC
jgi:hypothetical protein